MLQELEDSLENRELEYKKCEKLYSQREEQHMLRIEVVGVVIPFVQEVFALCQLWNFTYEILILVHFDVYPFYS